MKASELIERLQDLIEEYGDCRTFIYDGTVDIVEYDEDFPSFDLISAPYYDDE